MNATEKKAIRWLFGPRTGLSSQTMCCFFLTGEAMGRYHCEPADPSDFARCLGLLEAVPEWRKRIPELATLSDPWRQLVKNWDQLEALFHEESPSGECPKLFERMIKLRFPKRAPVKRSNDRG